jgi:hypothetical protein
MKWFFPFQAQQLLENHQRLKENNVSEPSEDQKILTVLATRLVEQRLPRLELIKAQLDRGEPLTDYDIRFLKEALADGQGNEALVARNPQVLEIASRVVHMYKEIMDKAIEVESNRQS